MTSFFPFMLLMVSLLRFTPLEMNIEEALMGGVINDVAGEFFAGVMREVSERATPGALLGAVGIFAIWAASRCLLSIIQGLNQVYSTKSNRSWWSLRLIAVVYVFVLQVIIVVSLGILVFGEEINDRLSSELGLKILDQSVIDLRWVMGFVLLVLFFVLIYTVVPERKNRMLSELPGALLGAGGWLGFSWLFSLYIAHFSDFGAVYGSLAAAVILMLWLYFCMYILFMGAQFNVWLQGKGFCGGNLKQAIKAKIRRNKTP